MSALNTACDACGADPREDCRPDCIAVVSILNGIEDATVRCSCAHNTDGSVTAFLCPSHASADPCATMAAVTGQRRRGSIVRGVCTACGWSR